ncbi:MAG: hypothetical protein CL666_12000 [Balneola sp.]|nr:hypothetical protein [Balneola sp.]|tara:strand:- start:21385 stop:22656 length:1272 start_codon:yes stop_codon:yes gene_type:complete
MINKKTSSKDIRVVLMILNQRFLPDVRVEQEYKSLKKLGYRVIVVASQSGNDSDEYEIIRVNNNKFKDWLYNLFFKTNPSNIQHIISQLANIKVYDVDVVHVHDLPWSDLGYRLSQHYKSKLIIDLHENYPAWQEDKKKLEDQLSNLRRYIRPIGSFLIKRNPEPLMKLVEKKYKTPKRWEKYENEMLRKSNKFIVVVEEALSRFENEPFFKKGSVVSNTKIITEWNKKDLPLIEDKIIISYMGSVQYLRGLDTAIKAMKYVDQNLYQLQIVGVIPESKIYSEFQDLIELHNINNVQLINYLEDEQKAFEYIYKSHIGIIPHRSSGLTETTVPHKLFMYMATGRPVLVSDVAPLSRIVNETKSGLVFKSGDPRSFAKTLKKLSSEEKLKMYSENARLSVENKYNWSQDEKKLTEIYSSLFDSI